MLLSISSMSVSTRTNVNAFQTPFTLFHQQKHKHTLHKDNKHYRHTTNKDMIYALPYDPSENLTPNNNNKLEQDRMGITSRQFSLGYDISLSRFAGSMGFDEVVDWDYFTNPFQAENELDRQVVEPPPLDPTKPKRTKSSSGGVVRLFLGEFQGGLGSQLRAKGLDNRVLVKEFSGEIAADLAKVCFLFVCIFCLHLFGLASNTYSDDSYRSAHIRQLVSFRLVWFGLLRLSLL